MKNPAMNPMPLPSARPEPGDNDSNSRTIFSALFVSVFSAMLGLGIIVPLLPAYAEGLGATGLWIGAIFSGFALARAIFMPIVGTISDRRGRRLFIIGGLAMYTVLSVAYLLAGTVYALIAVRFFHGIASAMVIPIAMAYVADYSPHGKEGNVMGTFMASLFLGMGFGPLIGGVVMDIAGMDAVFLSMAIFSLISLLICIVFLPESRGHMVQPASMLAALKNKTLVPVLFFRAMNAFSTGAIMVFIPILASSPPLHPEAALSAGEIGVIISASILSTALLQRFFGRMSDIYNKTTLIILGSVLLSLALFIFPFTYGFALYFVISAVSGIGSAIAIPASTALVAIAGRETGQGAAMGAYNTAMSVGMITAPLFFGLILDISGIAYVFVIAGILGCGTAFVFYALSKRSGIS
jgi:DHA1 family multidrug resistance protein-like MFS transporter